MSVTGKIVVIGLGYVGLPLAVAFAREFDHVVGFDVNELKVETLRRGMDPTGSVRDAELSASSLRVTSSKEELLGAQFYIVAVPTPVDSAHRPDLTPLIRASETVGRVMEAGAIICYESTVYPGVTEEICGPILARISGLRQGKDFKLGYSPERINPGDKVHTLETIIKVVSGEDADSRKLLADLYGAVVTAGIHVAPSIKVAEAAKVIENTQRDLNIALMNELAVIFDLVGVRTLDVLEAAGTKWNFLPFRPGLVGGHCIGVDPYYLTYKAEEMGYIPQVILAGRRINDGMGKFIAEKTIKLLCQNGNSIKGARIGVLGLTFKENVPDLRNSKVPDIVRELGAYGATVLVHDPLGEPAEAMHEYGITLFRRDQLCDLDAVVLAVGHDCYRQDGVAGILKDLKGGRGVLVDVKSLFVREPLSSDVHYWCL